MAVKPWPGRMSRPASTQPSTATVPAASTAPLRITALAASMADRRGTAASVVRIMPLLYSPLMTSTARTATAAWPSWTPVRLILAGSWSQPPDGQVIEAAARTLSPTVSAAPASSSHPVLGMVRNFVHSACSAVPMVCA